MFSCNCCRVTMHELFRTRKKMKLKACYLDLLCSSVLSPKLDVVCHTDTFLAAKRCKVCNVWQKN